MQTLQLKPPGAVATNSSLGALVPEFLDALCQGCRMSLFDQELTVLPAWYPDATGTHTAPNSI